MHGRGRERADVAEFDFPIADQHVIERTQPRRDGHELRVEVAGDADRREWQLRQIDRRMLPFDHGAHVECDVGYVWHSHAQRLAGPE